MDALIGASVDSLQQSGVNGVRGKQCSFSESMLWHKVTVAHRIPRMLPRDHALGLVQWMVDDGWFKE